MINARKDLLIEYQKAKLGVRNAGKKKLKKRKMADGRRIKDLTEEQLVSIIQNTIKGNHIEVSGVQVNSTTESLKDIEKIVDRLVEKHKDFLLLRKQLKLTTGFEG